MFLRDILVISLVALLSSSLLANDGRVDVDSFECKNIISVQRNDVGGYETLVVHGDNCLSQGGKHLTITVTPSKLSIGEKVFNDCVKMAFMALHSPDLTLHIVNNTKKFPQACVLRKG